MRNDALFPAPPIVERSSSLRLGLGWLIESYNQTVSGHDDSVAQESDSGSRDQADGRFGRARRKGRAGPGLIYRTVYRTPVVGNVVDQLRSEVFGLTTTGKHVTHNTQCQRCGTTYRHIPATRARVAKITGQYSTMRERRELKKALRHQRCPGCGSNETRPIALAGWYPVLTLT